MAEQRCKRCGNVREHTYHYDDSYSVNFHEFEPEDAAPAPMREVRKGVYTSDSVPQRVDDARLAEIINRPVAQPGAGGPLTQVSPIGASKRERTGVDGQPSSENLLTSSGAPSMGEQAEPAVGQARAEPIFPQKWAQDAFVLLAGLRHSVIWELAPAIVAKIARLVEQGLALKPEPAAGQGAEPIVTVMYDKERLKFIAIVAGTPLDIPIGFMRVSEVEPMQEFIKNAAAHVTKGLEARLAELIKQLHDAADVTAQLEATEARNLELMGELEREYKAGLELKTQRNLAREARENWRKRAETAEKRLAEAEKALQDMVDEFPPHGICDKCQHTHCQMKRETFAAAHKIAYPESRAALRPSEEGTK